MPEKKKDPPGEHAAVVASEVPGPLVPPGDLAALRHAARSCTACDLYKNATQVVFGEGPADARLIFIGEQPGDQEDQQGRPFVGPAGRLFDQALARAGITRKNIYVTNAVKHFKWEAVRGRRLHKKPNVGQIEACRPWLEAELVLLRPEGIVCLGATAARALLGAKFRITRDRGTFFPSPWGSPGGSWLTATLHPAAILRIPDPGEREAALAQLIADFQQVQRKLVGGSALVGPGNLR